MFDGCNELEYLDLSNFDTSNVDDMGKMFKQCTKLKKIIGINKFNMSKVTKKDEMFLGCDLEHLILSNFGNEVVNINNGDNGQKGKPFAIIFLNLLSSFVIVLNPILFPTFIFTTKLWN